MRFECGPTTEQRQVKRYSWHEWFAWYPVRLQNNSFCCWLEKVKRKRIRTPTQGGASWWIYHAVDPKGEDNV